MSITLFFLTRTTVFFRRVACHLFLPSTISWRSRYFGFLPVYFMVLFIVLFVILSDHRTFRYFQHSSAGHFKCFQSINCRWFQCPKIKNNHTQQRHQRFYSFKIISLLVRKYLLRCPNIQPTRHTDTCSLLLDPRQHHLTKVVHLYKVPTSRLFCFAAIYF